MMMFRLAVQALINLLGDNAESRFRVVGYQRQSKSADEIIGTNRLVQVYYSGGDFSKSGGRFNGEKQHDITVEIEMSASAKATGDLSVLDSTTATALQKANALANIKEAADVADGYIDELIEAVYQILMDARNSGLALPKGEISSRWIDRIEKNTLLEYGDLVVKTANMKYTCRVTENVSGDIGNEPEKVIIDSSLPLDDTDGVGVLTENENS
jgi:hypothetical protein